MQQERPGETAWIHVGSEEKVRREGIVVVPGRDHPVAVFAHDGLFSAVDNRCPHLGFPLHKGTVKDGILTCHWHEARFDLRSGCTFDLFADDVASFAVKVDRGEVYVSATPAHAHNAEYLARRMHKGLEQNIAVIIAKSVGSLVQSGMSPLEVARRVALFGCRRHDAWGVGMTTLTVAARLMPCLSDETAYYMLYRAARAVADDCSGAAPRRLSEPLLTHEHTPATLKRWLRQWVTARDRAGAERIVLTAATSGLSVELLTDLLFTAVADRIYADTGHVFDFTNKAFELMQFTGASGAAELLPLLMGRLTSARGAEEQGAWHHPVELVEPLLALTARLPETLAEGAGRMWPDDGSLRGILIGDDPLAILAALEAALRAGAPPCALSQRVAYAAALRLAMFSRNNEAGDWFGPQHTFTFCNAVHQALERSTAPGVVAALFHGALSVYMDRFLNVPPARLPGGGDALDRLPSDVGALHAVLLEALDNRAAHDLAAEATARHMRLKLPLELLVDTLTYATVREDLDFHYLQVLEAGVQQCREWGDGPEPEHIMVGVVRNLAAACPTRRAALQVADVALRLNRGECIHSDD